MLYCFLLSHSNQKLTKSGHVTRACLAGLVVQASVKLSITEVCVFVLVRVESSLCSWEVGNQYVPLDYSGFSIFRKAFTN